MKKAFLLLILCFFPVFGLVNAETVVPGHEQVLKTIRNAVEWFKNAQESDGHFRYEYMPFWDRYVDDDNMVRQAGALYVLGEVAVKMSTEDFDLQGNMENAVDYFKANSVDSKFGGYEFKCLEKTEGSCTLGGTSLLLIGILDLVEAYPDLGDKYDNLIEDYKNFILAMKVSDVGFMERYDPDKGSMQDGQESAFSNGEALFALVRYYMYNSSEEVRLIIEESLEYFIRKYSEEWDANFYLWGMAALKDWYKLFPDEKYFTFVKDYTDWRIGTQKQARKSSRNRCAYIEGVISAYSLLEKQSDEKEKMKYLEEINFWLAKSRFLQLRKIDRIKIIFNQNGAKILVIKKPLRAVGGFITDFSEPFQRIDFTQHCLNAYLQRLVD